MYKILLDIKDLKSYEDLEDLEDKKFKHLDAAREYVISSAIDEFKHKYKEIREDGCMCFTSLNEMTETIRDAVESNDELYLIYNHTAWYWRIKRINKK